MNGGEVGLSRLDRIMMIAFAVGCLMFPLGKRLWRSA